MVKSVTLSTGVTLQYVERGKTSGEPVVFLHGVTDSWRSFEPLLECLPDTIHALAITQRGHGGSSKPDEGYGYVHMAQDLFAFMDALGLSAAVIVGHSMGSLVAQRFAASYPDRVAGLVLMGAFRTCYNHPAVLDFWGSTVASLSDPVDREMVREFQSSTLAHPVSAELLELVVSESLCVPARVWRDTFREFLRTPDFSGELASLAAPTLIAWGERDAYALRADQDALQAAIPSSRLITYPDGGHAFHWESPDRFAADLVSFIYQRQSR